MTTAVSASSSSTNLAGLASSTQTSSADQQDRFLKLLVAQLNNQDPMNPMDNAQMTSQMAQINTVTGIEQLNSTIKSMANQFSSMQVLQGASLIGHDVMVQSNMLTVNGGVAKGAVDLPANADKVDVQILSPGGQLMDTLHLGSMTAGRHSFTWDASKYPGVTNPSFKVTASVGTATMPTTGLAQDTIVSIGNTGTGMSIQLKGRDAIAYDAVQSIL